MLISFSIFYLFDGWPGAYAASDTAYSQLEQNELDVPTKGHWCDVRSVLNFVRNLSVPESDASEAEGRMPMITFAAIRVNHQKFSFSALTIQKFSFSRVRILLDNFVETARAPHSSFFR